ncbi:2OG-Fe(II) oxygenase [Tatumella sp. UBA2305]|uniref:2OG-Fe(II) oxygenase n=1 Tax=Tatumella sp. UBA2305 TaxID=1947647 RepID=UPI0025CB8F03|nr:2OG-Fe(II) oxygenase [Tatumella sp. UBA2305]
MLDSDVLVQHLCEQGWFYQQNVLDSALVSQLAEICHNRTFLQAGIGQGVKNIINESIRSDSISWIDKDEQLPAIRDYLGLVETIRQLLNREFYLGLNDFEGHFSRYPSGAYYKPHYDCFANDKRRAVTLIMYINQNWHPQDGGQLCLHLPEGERLIEPVAGSVICFLSEQILHEVKPAHKERMALTGWYIRNNGQDYYYS